MAVKDVAQLAQTKRDEVVSLKVDLDAAKIAYLAAHDAYVAAQEALEVANKELDVREAAVTDAALAPGATISSVP
jgi:hypothetical protein